MTFSLEREFVAESVLQWREGGGVPDLRAFIRRENRLKRSKFGLVRDVFNDQVSTDFSRFTSLCALHADLCSISRFKSDF